jgi:orotidine-5'-phosphate decarboxylase
MQSRNTTTELIVALDYSKTDQALALTEGLKGLPVIYKVGFELFLQDGPAFVRELVHRHHRVFLDLKFHDIPNTVAQAAKQAAFLRVEMLTLHLAGGSQMIKAVKSEIDQIPEIRPKILGVSVLTSFDESRWAEVTKSLTGHTAFVEDSVKGIVKNAQNWGCDGVVCSPLEVAAIRRSHPDLTLVVPGIRPTGSESQDQSRVMTPFQAKLAGASMLVVGRPITQAKEPRLVVENILKEIQ